MPNFQVVKFDSINKKWTQAWGLKNPIFPKFATRQDAITQFKESNQDCNSHLLLLEHYDFGSKRIILSQINPIHDINLIVEELQEGHHSELMLFLKQQLIEIDFDEGTKKERNERLFQGLSQFIFPENITPRLDYTFTLVETSNGYNDYTINHHPLITRACVPHDIKTSDRFNVYYGESSKSSARWDGDLILSLEDTVFTINEYEFSYNPYYEEFQVHHHSVIGPCESFDDLREAIDYCNKG
ncbi:hypothetical protein GNP82_07940 [Aliivibrio fischeri]|uniref:hypothetical protein n=1 Tax=Aliivibrio fischeri TaxID=668 RepID=UPI0012D989F2|nr:hypothetical protein [Aliivibrio fischeri]MUK37478.1 hypothetical protein [Aliivibrio fischeri]